MRRIPITLVALRFVLALILLGLGLFDPIPSLIAGCLTGAILSDYFDGVIARRLGVATPTLRRLDSIVDTIFYGCALIAVARNDLATLERYRIPLLALIAIEVARYAYDFRKFGKEASYHMWSSKAWGLLLFLAMYSLLVVHSSGWIVPLAIYWGIAADLEGLAISMILPTWRPDVATWWHARLVARSEAVL
jgi:CDP-diacylglycerol--glycerol-3-phosphate 3-phosphatidyltransferase